MLASSKYASIKPIAGVITRVLARVLKPLRHRRFQLRGTVASHINIAAHLLAAASRNQRFLVTNETRSANDGSESRVDREEASHDILLCSGLTRVARGEYYVTAMSCSRIHWKRAIDTERMTRARVQHRSRASASVGETRSVFIA